MSKIIDAVAALAGPAAEKHGCEIWDIEYVKEAGCRVLRVFIDRPEGVNIGHCEAVSRELDPLLDELDALFSDSYTFEVSSAGVERRLRGPGDYERFAGRLAEVRLYKSRDGQKSFLGSLSGSANGGVELEIDGERRIFEKEEIASVRLR